ncbi:hypothetical protein FHETE_6912 [Fusarium heterosporum]|uniref:Uncharacterized protein n=1 Tax=Fusarium heterosporum TaxID=42747 RepID=A0A8H5T7Z0_FUSHE|nr:hypothetical protein FHETE_6912 [Fusarium heterosporum]
MAQNKTTQDEHPPSIEQRRNSSDDNEPKQMSETSKNNQVGHSGTEQPVQPQTQQPQPASQGSGKKSSAPRVKLDMDLDMELQLKAKIQGDLELAVLVSSKSSSKGFNAIDLEVQRRVRRDMVATDWRAIQDPAFILLADEVLEENYNVILGLDEKLRNLANDVPNEFKSGLETDFIARIYSRPTQILNILLSYDKHPFAKESPET